MKFNFFKWKTTKKVEKPSEIVESKDFETFELEEYDQHVKFYYNNIINSLVLFTYNSAELDKMEPILIDPLTELYEELDYAFTPVLFETVFRNNFIDASLKVDLLVFRTRVEKISTEIWDWEFLDTHEDWKNIRLEAKNLLSKLNIKSRAYNNDFTTIISKDGETLF
ncbi:MAG TPA: hypothetical protein VF455_04735 [Chryseobacterium sp.]